MELPVVARLKKELADLKYELTFKLPKELEAARAHGDLSENAEYEAAKNRQDFVRSRIGQLEGRIRELAMYNVASIPADVVAYGSRVTVEDVDQGESTVYNIVFPEEVDAASGAISLSSPIGRALLTQPRLVLLDEPSMGLAPKIVQEIFQIIVRLNREKGVAFLLAEQNAALSLAHASRAYILESGRVALEGGADELAARDDLHHIYLGGGS